jgi:hypothetical protein
VLFLAAALLIASDAGAEPAKSNAGTSRPPVTSVRVISPIFSQLVTFLLPKGFKTAFENTNGNSYIREAVPEGETVERWSQMITVTGAKGAAANVTPRAFADRIAGGFKRACPDTFSAKEIGVSKLGAHEAFVALASCGTAPSGPTTHSETAMLVAIKGTADIYTIQWAERGTPSSRPIVLDPAAWAPRWNQLNPIKLCAVVPGEPAPYPSCINQP